LNLIVNQQLLNYSDAGDRGAPVVVLLHGWGANGRSFDQLAAALGQSNRVIRLDLPGFGESEVPRASWRISNYAELLQQFLRKLEITDIRGLIGHSFGGRVAIKSVGKGLLAPSRLILMDAAGIKHSDSARNHMFRITAKIGKAATALPGLSGLRVRLRRGLYRAAGSTDYLDAGPMREILLGTIAEDLQADAAQIDVSTLIIWGGKDADTPLSDGNLLAAIIPKSKLEVVQSAGHFVYLDAPDIVTKLIQDFLA
jgi:pimeloyl-ACP methyl ester carboxylesterase